MESESESSVRNVYEEEKAPSTSAQLVLHQRDETPADKDDSVDPDTNPALQFTIRISATWLPILQMQPSAPALIEISRLCYRELSTDDINIHKIISPECLDYYATAMLWFRFISLKQKQKQTLTTNESLIALQLRYVSFSIPEPILMQLKLFGTIETITGDGFILSVPSLPDASIHDFGGYYGPITLENHNLYEEIPCLGVLAEAVRYSITNPDITYVSSLSTSQCKVNLNLLGFKPLDQRPYKSRRLITEFGITPESFPEFPKGTGLNMELLKFISSYLARTKTFKITTLNINTLPGNGSLAQITIQHTKSGDSTILEKNSNISVGTSIQSYESVYGVALVYLPQLMKFSTTRDSAKTWCCINNPDKSWITNRNARRTSLAERYREKIFSSMTYSSDIIRLNAINQMVISGK